MHGAHEQEDRKNGEDTQGRHQLSLHRALRLEE
jgi:hypothetical protein